MEATVRLAGTANAGYEVTISLPVAFCEKFAATTNVRVAGRALHQRWGFGVGCVTRMVASQFDDLDEADGARDRYVEEIVAALKILRIPGVDRTSVVNLGE